MKIRYGRQNIRLGKCLSGDMYSRGSFRRGSVQSWNCPVREVSIEGVSVGEMSVRDLSSGKCQSGNCPKISLNRINAPVFKLESLKTNPNCSNQKYFTTASNKFLIRNKSLSIKDKEFVCRVF